MTNNRFKNIAIYYDTTTSCNHCRLCCSNIAKQNRHIHNICDILETMDYTQRKRKLCCSYSSPAKRWYKRFQFDNTTCKIILSTKECSLCTICTGIQNCTYNISNIMKTFDKEIENVDDKE